jgi:hypothetical protein
MQQLAKMMNFCEPVRLPFDCHWIIRVRVVEMRGLDRRYLFTRRDGNRRDEFRCA